MTQLVLNPDPRAEYGALIGCVLVSPTHIYPGPVGVDIKCSMSLLQMNVAADAIADVRTRRAIINAILERVPTGAGKGAAVGEKVAACECRPTGRQIAVEGASPEVCVQLGIPEAWAARCEDAFHVGHDGSRDALALRIDKLLAAGNVLTNFEEKVGQLGSYGGGNHFGEAEVVQVRESGRILQRCLDRQDGKVAFLSHCGSRGLGISWRAISFASCMGCFWTRGRRRFPVPPRQGVERCAAGDGGGGCVY